MNDRPWTSQIKKGLLEMAVLAALRPGEAYGYQLLQRLAHQPLLATTESTLYPLLGRLADDRLVAVRQAPSPTGPPRRYYRLTARGVAHLNQLTDHWHRLGREIDALLADTTLKEAPHDKH